MSIYYLIVVAGVIFIALVAGLFGIHNKKNQTREDDDYGNKKIPLKSAPAPAPPVEYAQAYEPAASPAPQEGAYMESFESVANGGARTRQQTNIERGAEPSAVANKNVSKGGSFPTMDKAKRGTGGSSSNLAKCLIDEFYSTTDQNKYEEAAMAAERAYRAGAMANEPAAEAQPLRRAEAQPPVQASQWVETPPLVQASQRVETPPPIQASQRVETPPPVQALWRAEAQPPAQALQWELTEPPVQPLQRDISQWGEIQTPIQPLQRDVAQTPVQPLQRDIVQPHIQPSQWEEMQLHVQQLQRDMVQPSVRPLQRDMVQPPVRPLQRDMVQPPVQSLQWEEIQTPIQPLQRDVAQPPVQPLQRDMAQTPVQPSQREETKPQPQALPPIQPFPPVQMPPLSHAKQPARVLPPLQGLPSMKAQTPVQTPPQEGLSQIQAQPQVQAQPLIQPALQEPANGSVAEPSLDEDFMAANMHIYMKYENNEFRWFKTADEIYGDLINNRSVSEPSPDNHGVSGYSLHTSHVLEHVL